MGLASEIQLAAGKLLFERNFLWVGQNITYFFRKCECDILGINQNHYFIEIEVKTSKSDFKADFQKSRWVPMQKIIRDGKIDRGSKLLNITRFPNRHYYCCPIGVIDPQEVPQWSGLMYFDLDTQQIVVVKPAPLLHKNKVNLEKSLRFAARRSTRREFT